MGKGHEKWKLNKRRSGGSEGGKLVMITEVLQVIIYCSYIDVA